MNKVSFLSNLLEKLRVWKRPISTAVAATKSVSSLPEVATTIREAPASSTSLGDKLRGFFGDVLDSAKTSPDEVVQSAWADNVSVPLRTMSEAVDKGEIWEGIKAQGWKLPLGALGVGMAAGSLLPDRADLDSAGPMENIGTRAGELFGTAAMFSPAYFNKGIVSGMIGSNIAAYGAEKGGKLIGRLADTVAETAPSPSELGEKFNNRIMAKIEAIKQRHPGIDDQSAGQVAVQEFLQENPNYDLSFTKM